MGSSEGEEGYGGEVKGSNAEDAEAAEVRRAGEELKHEGTKDTKRGPERGH
jgi:hypothetical protein